MLISKVRAGLSYVLRASTGVFSVFILLNVLRECWAPSNFDANIWWIGLNWLPPAAARVFWMAAGGLLLALACCPAAGNPRRWLTAVIVAVLLANALADALNCWLLAARGQIALGVPVPFSLGVAIGLSLLLHTLIRSAGAAETHAGAGNRKLRAAALVLCAAGVLAAFPLAQMFLFGKTDYRRRAECAVVFGARAYADGRPSQALADRVVTACELYHAGLVKKLICSGGPGDGAVHETDVMRALAMRLGVPSEAIILDREGLNTRATIAQTREIAGRLGAQRILAVSHFYHLPRIKQASLQAGLDVCTVPAHERRTLTQMPWLMAREVAAWWAYWLDYRAEPA